MTDTPNQPTMLPHRAALIAALLIPAAGTLWLASVANPDPTSAVLATILERLLQSGSVAAAYLLGGVGLGRCWSPLFRTSPNRALLQACTGLATLLTLSHAMGCLGLLKPSTTSLAWIPPAIGLALLAHQFLPLLRGTPLNPRVRVTTLPAFLGIAILLAAACNPPGWLWDSEFGGFDALSYHLALPQEWYAGGKLAPVTHNVYSYLPSAFEAAFLHLTCMLHAPGPAANAGAAGLIANDARAAFACQFLAVGTAILAAWAIARAAATFACALSPEANATNEELDDRPALAGSLAFSLTLATPWLLVVGSLAYNDAAMLAFSAASLAAAADRSLSPVRKGLLVGVLVGAAVACKPTAIFFAAPPAALTMLVVSRSVPDRSSRFIRDVLLSLTAAALTGSLMIAPWALRNFLACGNPVFPFASNIFGLAHWSTEQHARFADAHHFSGSLLARLQLLILPDPTDPAGLRHRGLLHPQWRWLFPAALIAALIALVRHRASKPILALLAILFLQLAAWLAFTHLQSRFLLPLLPTLAILIALAAIPRLHTPSTPRITPGPFLATLLALAHALWSVNLYTHQRNDHPNQSLTAGTTLFTGEFARPELAKLSQAERNQLLTQLSPAAFVNLALRPETKVALVGDVLPLWFNTPPIYCTTWDRSPLADAMKASPNTPAEWTNALRATGARAVLVNLAELRRYARSNTLDPDLREDAIASWIKTLPILQAWPDQGIILAALEPTP